MLNIDYICNNTQKVRDAILHKQMSFNLEHLLDLDEKRRLLKTEIDELRQKQNQITEKIQQHTGKPPAKLIQNAKEVKKLLLGIEKKYTRVKKEFEDLMLLVPNIYSEDTPIGESEKDNVVIENIGEIPSYDFDIKDHITLGKDLDIIDLERGAKIGGFRAYFLKNEGVLLHFAVMMHAIQQMISHGFTLMVPPTLVKDFTMYGSGWFPFDMDNIYKVVPAGKLDSKKNTDEGTNLVGTSEPSLCAYYSDEILQEKDLPVRLCGVSQCYRSEIGSYGKDTRGLYRMHEFMKAEQVVICKGDYKTSNEWHQKMIQISSDILTDLGLPHRIVQMCTGDMGAGKYKMFDIETWMPARKSYGETHSASNLGDWQSRRLKVRYKTRDGKTKYVHMLNNTVIASPRILIALLENFQQKDGTVKIPKPLQQWVGKKVISKKL